VQFVAITTVKPSVAVHPPADYALHLQEEAAQTHRALADGVYLHAWQKHDLTGAVIILEAASLAAATAVVEQHPFVKARYADLDVVAIDPFPPPLG
jgi:uncharacterized protein YciI